MKYQIEELVFTPEYELGRYNVKIRDNIDDFDKDMVETFYPFKRGQITCQQNGKTKLVATISNGKMLDKRIRKQKEQILKKKKRP